MLNAGEILRHRPPRGIFSRIGTVCCRQDCGGERNLTGREGIFCLLAAILLTLLSAGCSTHGIPEIAHPPYSRTEITRRTVFFDIPEQAAVKNPDSAPLPEENFPAENVENSAGPFSFTVNPSISRVELAGQAVRFGEAARRFEAQPRKAVQAYLGSIQAAYRVLFDATTADPIMPDSPEQQTALAAYNRSLDGLLRLMSRYRPQEISSDAASETDEKNSEKALFPFRPNETAVLTLGENTETIPVRLCAAVWQMEEFGELSFALAGSPESVPAQEPGKTLTGAKNGIGIPILVRRQQGISRPEEGYLPQTLYFPMTLVLRLEPVPVFELIDPFAQSAFAVQGRALPLAVDISSVLRRTFDEAVSTQFANAGLFQPELFFQPLPLSEKAHERSVGGLYLIQPYSPKKIPILFIHGLWSSPGTWRNMVELLEQVPAIRENFQFWFYSYPTGLPWWFAAAHLRQDLAEIRALLDPNHQAAALDEMAVIGHSMGGLIARLQVAESGNILWNLNSDIPPEDLFGHPHPKITDAFFFTPNRSIRRIITIAAPNRGSRSVTALRLRLADHLIDAPIYAAQNIALLADADPLHLKHPNLLTVQNSIEALSPDSPIFSVLETLPVPENVVFNNMIGYQISSNPLDRMESDGVVERSSTDFARADTVLTVEASHMQVHRHPVIIEAAANLLLEHLYRMKDEERTALRENRKSLR